MAEVKKFVDTKVAGKKVVVFSKSWCPYCKKAKQALQGHDLSSEDYEVIEIEDRNDCDAIQNYLKQLTGGRSVPRVFINGKCIGGGDETAAAEKGGKLAELLAA